MLTWKLWRCLNTPFTRHPLFRRSAHGGAASDQLAEWSRLLGIFGLGLCGATIFMPGLLSGLVFLCFSAPFLFILFNGTLFGAHWAMLIAVTITQEREQGTHDLLCISPVGQLGAAWLLGTGRLHRRNGFHQVHGGVRGLVIVALVMLAIIAVIILLNVAYSQTPTPLIRLQAFVALATAATVLAAFYVDHVQSLIVGCLVGMIAPTYAASRVEIRMWAAGVFLLLQVSAYLLFWIGGMIVLEYLFDLLQLQGGLSLLALSLARLAIFYGVREGFIALLWNTLQRRLNAGEAEFELVSRLSA